MPSSSLDYSKEPSRPQYELIVRKETPFNAEPRIQNLVEHYITPEKYMFVRSHGPVPTHLDESHIITVQGLADAKQFSVQQLKTQFEKAHVMMAMQCAGNRRDGLHRVKHTKGVIWGAAAVGNTTFAGCRLRDVLHAVGVVSYKNDLHVSFESVEQVITCEETACYGSSIPLCKALDEFGDVLLAYEMNGHTLTHDHGYPIRVVVPGYIGARSVKYLKSITVQDHESTSYFQQRDYKLLPAQVGTEQEAEEYWCKVPAIGEYNVQSFVCHPAHDSDKVVAEGTRLTAQGYALSGGGRSIQRVDVSNDNGDTWQVAELYQPSMSARAWGWCLWTIKNIEYKGYPIVSRAVDSAGNVQQEYPVWNYRGVLNNAWRTVNL
ncbi:putative sulfite oxidase [Zychaea mexicana]|uniref:putative sulfite oxidase n=1 Tax=Zychaea mexicana TaxID=64656 RepID=UPI0022FE7C66|nr:putative sulfite oxidase [Zychaea mexicana]KAI9489618.1 putative sulfite oxidase [Zychaea mexicana]